MTPASVGLGEPRAAASASRPPCARVPEIATEVRRRVKKALKEQLGKDAF